MEDENVTSFGWLINKPLRLVRVYLDQKVSVAHLPCGYAKSGLHNLISRAGHSYAVNLEEGKHHFFPFVDNSLKAGLKRLSVLRARISIFSSSVISK